MLGESGLLGVSDHISCDGFPTVVGEVGEEPLGGFGALAAVLDRSPFGVEEVGDVLVGLAQDDEPADVRGAFLGVHHARLDPVSDARGVPGGDVGLDHRQHTGAVFGFGVGGEPDGGADHLPELGGPGDHVQWVRVVGLAEVGDSHHRDVELLGESGEGFHVAPNHALLGELGPAEGGQQGVEDDQAGAGGEDRLA